MRGDKITRLCLGLLTLLAACSVPPPAPVAPSLKNSFLPVKDYQHTLKARSCPDPDAFITPQSIKLTATPLPHPTEEGASLNGLSFAGGWNLTSEEANFGGLSGLTIHPKDHLLAVSDAGAFIWISMADHAPSGYAAIAFMKDEAGTILDGKASADSEGLEMVDGLALVSFERDHRILAFDLANCGAAAKGTLLTRLPTNPEGLSRSLPKNRGAEALSLAPSGQLQVGFEAPFGAFATILDASQQGSALSAHIPRVGKGVLTGLDTEGETRFALFRSYSPLSGNTAAITRQIGSAPPETLATLAPPFPVDNFEGITATRLPDGTLRLYIISDDNFSQKQRTLLLAFDLLE